MNYKSKTLLGISSMPKARTSAQKVSNRGIASKPSPKGSAANGKSNSKDPRNSHLYTDDNPSTTLSGTGFKDAATAEHTLNIISERSITYQFQVVNTMFHRAAGHPSVKKGGAGAADMQEAMKIFRSWLDETYPAAKGALRNKGFKPPLGKDILQGYLDDIRNADQRSHISGRVFAEMYTELPQGKRLANVLVDEKNPAGRDWERERYEALNDLVPEGMENSRAWKHEELWENNGKPTQQHLAMIAWAWSPNTSKALK